LSATAGLRQQRDPADGEIDAVFAPDSLITVAAQMVPAADNDLLPFWVCADIADSSQVSR